MDKIYNDRIFRVDLEGLRRKKGLGKIFQGLSWYVFSVYNRCS